MIPHRSKFVTNWKYKNNISCLEWPLNSPDLNPIENIWFIVKNNVSRKRTNTSEEFELSIRHELDNIDIKSMPKRIEEVIKNNGDHINY